MSGSTRLLIPAAGMGTRLGANQPKALVEVGGAPLLVRTLGRFAPLGLLENALITVPPAARSQFESVLRTIFPGVAFQIIDGGAERQDSVARALAALDASCKVLVIHDAARPFVSEESILNSIRVATEYGAATVAIPAVDTILVGDPDGFLVDTPDRTVLWACQTPQTFRVEVLRAAHEAARRENFLGTDDASLVRRNGNRVRLVQGSPLNFKITTQHDLDIARCIIEGGLV